jgi:hypothetical protein
MKFPLRTHPSITAYYRDLQRHLFVMEAAEYGDNLYVQHQEDGTCEPKTTLGAIKIAAFDELMAADPVTKLRNALDALLRDPCNGDRHVEAIQVLNSTARFVSKA